MNEKKVAIVQSNYIPWKGYFDLIGSVDEFVLYDDAQYTRRDWRNRNKIKTSAGLQWLTLPVEAKGKYDYPIREIRLANPDWARIHWESLRHAYRKAPFADWCRDWLQAVYERTASEPLLSHVNRTFLEAICDRLGIQTKITWSMDYRIQGERSEKLLSICRQAGAAVYLSGPAAQCYLDIDMFNDAGVSVEWMDYSAYPEYPQLYPPFEHGVSVLDVLFMTGPDAPKYLKTATRGSQ